MRDDEEDPRLHSSTAVWQWLESTWGHHYDAPPSGGGKPVDPETQTLAGLQYICERYGYGMAGW